MYLYLQLDPFARFSNQEALAADNPCQKSRGPLEDQFIQ